MPRAGPLAGVNLLELAPRPLAAWHEQDGYVVLERPLPPRGWRHLGARLAFLLAPRRLRLDELGSAAWLLFDGRRPCGEAAAELRRRYGAAAEPVEERLGQFVRQLRREGLVVYPGVDPDLP